MTICVYAGLAVTIAMIFAWWLQRATQNAGWVDVVWTFSSSLALASVALAAPGITWRQIMLAIILLMWGARLGGYIAWRVATQPEDARYALMRQTSGRGFQYKMAWLIAGQGPVTGLISLGVYLAAAQPSPSFCFTDGLGVAIIILALAGEALADFQLKSWKAQQTNAKGICTVGLWSLCRHPNYFCEFLFWVAFPVIAFTQKPLTWVALIAPLLMFLVLRYLTGVPPLEATMLARRGKIYRDYQAQTNAMWPSFKKRPFTSQPDHHNH